MADAAGATHDITLALPGGAAQGFMVDWANGPLRDKIYTRTAPKVNQGDFSHENYQLESYYSQDDFSGGLAQYRRKNDKRYWDGVADTRDIEAVRPGPTFTQKAVDWSLPQILWADKFVDRYNSTLWLISSSFVHSYNTATGNWDVDATYPDTNALSSTDAVLYKGTLYIARGDSNAIASRNAAGAWANLTVNGTHLAVYEDALWMSDAESKLYYAATPAGSWTTFPGEVGTSDGLIRRLAVFKGKLYVVKDDGLYYVNGKTGDGVAHLVMPFERRNANPTTGWLLYAWHGWLYFSVGTALWRHDGENTVEQVSYNFGAGGRAYANYAYLAATGDDLYLYVLVSNSPTSPGVAKVMAYDGVSSGGAGWHCLWSSAASRHPGAMVISDITGTPTLFASLYDGATSEYTISLPNPRNPASFATGGTLTMSLDNLKLSDVDKWLAQVEVEADNLSATNKIGVTAYVDGTAYAIGDFTLSPQEARNFPANTTGRRLYLVLTFTVSDAANPPQLRSVVVRGIPNVAPKRVITCWVKLADSIRLLHGSEQAVASVKLAFLRSCAASTAPCTLGLPDGTSLSVKLIESPEVLWGQVHRMDNVRDFSGSVGLQMMEV